MRFLLIYYTGTYNTRFLSGKLKEALTREGSEVTLVEISADTPVVETEGYDYIGFSYPIYGFNPPHAFLKYFFQLKFTPGQKFFIYKNSGETFAMNNASSRRILRAMRRQKARFCGEYHFVMPYNIHFEFDPVFLHQIVHYDKMLLEILLHDLKTGRAPALKSNFIYNIGAFFVSIQALGGPVNSFLYAVDGQKCNQCGLCIKNCPQKNISLRRGKIRFGHRCDMCMRCSFYCPKKAIQIGFLKGWRVHRYYDLEEIWANTREDAQYVTEESKGFYRCFVPYFRAIETRYNSIGSGE